MRGVRSIAILCAAAPGLVMVGCGGISTSGGSLFAGTAYPLTVSPQPAAVAAGSTVTFTATTTSPTVTWGLVGTDANTNGAGGTPQTAAGTTYTYTAPATPPTFDHLNPGIVKVRTMAGLTVVETAFSITTPSVSVGYYAPLSTSVALGTTETITAYSVGSVDHGLSAQVNGVTGGSTSTGTIAPGVNAVYAGQYTYTAPATMPMTGNTVNVTFVAHADPTKTATVTLTLH